MVLQLLLGLVRIRKNVEIIGRGHPLTPTVRWPGLLLLVWLGGSLGSCSDSFETASRQTHRELDRDALKNSLAESLGLLRALVDSLGLAVAFIPDWHTVDVRCNNVCDPTVKQL